MAEKIRTGIVGYGNLGRGVELALTRNTDFELKGIFTRRDPVTMRSATGGQCFVHVSDAEEYKNQIDVAILCGGSATDIPEQGPFFAALFNTVDSYDTHAKIPEHLSLMDRVAKENGHLSIISTGWDPGLFSLNRMIFDAILPDGNEYTFWGKGVSQGHSDAIRRIPGVKAGVQYTVPREEALGQVRAGHNPKLSTREKHTRVCYVVAEEGANKEELALAIKGMPHYFADYDTSVYFVTEAKLQSSHSGMPHGGFVIRSGRTGAGNKQIAEFGLNLESNPEFTASVMVAYARAAYRLAREGQTGARTVFDIPPACLSPKPVISLTRELL